MILREGKILVVINDALRKDAGFYYCRSKSGVFSSWLKLKVVGKYSDVNLFLPVNFPWKNVRAPGGIRTHDLTGC